MDHQILDHRTIEIVTFSTLYPNASAPNHGVFVESRLQHLLQGGRVSSRVVAPVPWFPFRSRIFGRYSAMARVPPIEERGEMRILHPKFPVLPKIGMSLAPALLFAACLPVLRRLRRERDFDLIDAHYFYPDGVAAVMLGKALGKPVVITARGTDVNFIPKYTTPRLQIKWAGRRAAGIVTVSSALKDALIELGVDGNDVVVLRNGVDLELFSPRDRKKTREHLNLASPTLLSVGQLIERKANDLVIGALPSLSGFTLLLVGEGPERSRLINLAQRLGVADRVRFLGVIPHRQLAEIYSAADILVLASSREGWPNVLLESMACGTPVVASNIWGNPEVVGAPEAGCLMEERTPEGVANAVLRLFARLPDRKDTRRYAEKFSWEETSQGQVQLFERVIAAYAPHRGPEKMKRVASLH